MDLSEGVSSISITQQKENNSEEMQCPICVMKATKTCSACKSVAYCCVEHQKLDWKNHKKVCQPFIIKETEDMGMGWFATRDLEAGVVLLEEGYAIKTPGWKISCANGDDRKCISCGAGSERMKYCSTCHWPVCSRTCEKDPLHMENECKELASRKLKYSPRPNWQIGMLTACMRAHGMKSRDPKKFKQLMELQDFYSIPSANQELQNLDLPPGMFEVLSGPNSLNREDYRKFLRICKVNAFEGELTPAMLCSNDGSVKLPSEVYLKISRINHSCFPNCMIDIIPPPCLNFRVRTAVPVAKGEQFTINYYDSNNGFGFDTTDSRQNRIQSKGFICKCKRCLDPTELGTFLSGIKCFNCSRHLKAYSDEDADKIGFLIPADPLEYKSPDPLFECHRCQFKVPFLGIMATLPRAVQQAYLEFQDLARDKFVDHKALETYLNKYEKDPAMKEHLHQNHWVIHGAIWRVTKIQGQNWKSMKEHELERLVSRLELLLSVDDKLYPGPVFRTKYEGVKLLFQVTLVFSKMVGHNMPREKRMKLKQTFCKAGKEFGAFLKVHAATASTGNTKMLAAALKLVEDGEKQLLSLARQ